MSRPEYLNLRITPARRETIDAFRKAMRTPVATDAEVIDAALSVALAFARSAWAGKR